MSKPTFNAHLVVMPLATVLLTGLVLAIPQNGRKQTEAFDQRIAQRSPKETRDPDMEDGKSLFKRVLANSFLGWGTELCCQYSAALVPSPGRVGNQSIRFTLFRSDPDVYNNRRAEFRHRSVPLNSTYTYRFSIFLPESYIPDRSFEIVTQWHEWPDFRLGETWRSPPLSLLTQDGRWKLHRRWDPNPLTHKNTPGPGGGTETVDLGAYQQNHWTDWTIYVRWSYGADGQIEVRRNNQLVFQHIGPNTYNDRQGPYFKIGLYKPDWKWRAASSSTTQRVIYFDKVSVEQQQAS